MKMSEPQMYQFIAACDEVGIQVTMGFCRDWEC